MTKEEYVFLQTIAFDPYQEYYFGLLDEVTASQLEMRDMIVIEDTPVGNVATLTPYGRHMFENNKEF